MLTSLYVRQFAVVEAAEIAFGPGLTVVSGETGAGKSLLVDALMLLAGARADSGMVRAGSDRAELAAEFDLAGAARGRVTGCSARSWTRTAPASCAGSSAPRAAPRHGSTAAPPTPASWASSLRCWSRSMASTSTRRCFRARISWPCSTPTPGTNGC